MTGLFNRLTNGKGRNHLHHKVNRYNISHLVHPINLAGTHRGQITINNLFLHINSYSHRLITMMPINGTNNVNGTLINNNKIRGGDMSLITITIMNTHGTMTHIINNTNLTTGISILARRGIIHIRKVQVINTINTHSLSPKVLTHCSLTSHIIFRNLLRRRHCIIYN